MGVTTSATERALSFARVARQLVGVDGLWSSWVCSTGDSPERGRHGKPLGTTHAQHTPWRRRAAWHLCVTLVRVVLCGERRVALRNLASLASFAVIGPLHPIRRADHHPIGALSRTIRSFNSVFSQSNVPIGRLNIAPTYLASRMEISRRTTIAAEPSIEPFMPAWAAVTLFSSLPTKPANASQRFASIFFASIFSNSRPRSYHISKERF